MKYYDEYWAENAEWSPNHGVLSSNEKHVFKTFCKAGNTVLDYGCGDAGRYGQHLTDLGVLYNGFDISNTAVESAQSRDLNVRLLDDNGLTTMADDSANQAFCFEVLEHLMRPDTALNEIHRVLKNGGDLFLSVPNIGYLAIRIEFLLTGFLCPGGSPLTSRLSPWNDAHIRFYNLSMLKRMVAASGFSVVKCYGSKFSLGDFPYVYKRPLLSKFFNMLSFPFQFLGYAFPSLFSGRIFLHVVKSKS